MNMFNLFPKYGSPGDSISPEELVGKYSTLLKENKDLNDLLESIEEDGTEEHNNAIRLREENVKLKNECTLLRSKNNTLQEFIDTKIKVDWKSARIDILERDLQKCAEQRDEFKHQLDAANKEIEVLKKEKKESFEIFKKAIEDESARFYKLLVEDTNNWNNLKASNKEIEELKKWKKEQLTVQSWWDKVDSYIRDHDDAPLGGFTANTCLNFLKERDRQKEEIAKLKQDIVDYVIVKDDKIEQLQKELNHMKAVAEGAISLCDLSDKTDYDLATNEIKKTQDWKELKAREEKRYFVCNHCGYRVAHDTNYWGGCGFCKEGLMIEKEVEEQKHPMYPIHWGGWDKIEITTSSTDEWNCPCNKCKDARINKKEKSWVEAASDLTLRVAKIEEQLKYTQKIVCPE
jgi:hypothetical protein